MIRRLHLAGEVVEVAAVTGHTVTGRRVSRVLHLECAARGIRAGMESRVLGVGLERGRRNGILVHRHPGVPTLVAALAVAGDTGVDLCRRRRRRQELGTRCGERCISLYQTVGHRAHMALFAVGTRRDVRGRTASRRDGRHHHNLRDTDKRRRRNRGAVTARAGGYARVVHLRVRKLRAVAHRRDGHAGSGPDVADLARLAGRHVIRRQPHHIEVDRRDRVGRRGRSMTLSAVRALARGIGMDVEEARHHREVPTRILVTTGTCRGRRYRDVIRRLLRRTEVREIGAVTVDAFAAGRVARVLNHEGARRRARARLETHVVRRRGRGLRGRIQRILPHRHPGKAALVAAVAATRHVGMNLIRRRCRL